jgi:thioredoxin-dependent peroxiredoxin
MLPIGSIAPDFTLPDDTGQPVALSYLLAQGPVILFFYPGDSTPLCTKQACMVRDVLDDLARVGVRVVGVSPQGSASKAAFRSAHGLRHVMLADEGSRVAKLYGATGLFGLPIPFGTRRTTYAIASDGHITEAVHAEFGLSAHEALLHRIVRSRSA